MLFAFRCLQEIWWPELVLSRAAGYDSRGRGDGEGWWTVLLPRACPAVVSGEVSTELIKHEN